MFSHESDGGAEIFSWRNDAEPFATNFGCSRPVHVSQVEQPLHHDVQDSAAMYVPVAVTPGEGCERGQRGRNQCPTQRRYRRVGRGYLDLACRQTNRLGV